MPTFTLTETVDTLFETASRHLQAGQIHPAVETYQRILAIHPDHPRAIHALGVIAFQQGNEETGLDLVSKALFLQEDYADAYNSLGTMLMKRGNLDEATANFRKAVVMKPESVIALVNLGKALRSLGKPDEAEHCFRKAVETDPSCIEGLLLLGISQSTAGRLDDAIDSYRRALAIRPELAAAHLNLGIAYRERGMTAEARETLAKAVELLPGSAEAHFHLGTVYQKMNLLDDAAACYREAILLRPEFADAHNNLGNILAEQNNPNEAERCYQAAVKHRPGFSLAHNNLGNILTEAGRYEDAARSYQQAIELAPDYADAHANLGNVLSLLDLDEAALESCRKAVALQPGDAGFLKNLGNVLAHLCRHQDAVDCFQRALALLPKEAQQEQAFARSADSPATAVTLRIPLTAEIHFGLANTFRNLNRLEDAATEYLQAIACMPAFEKAYNNLGNVRKDQGRLDEALACYRKCVEVSPDCAEGHSNLIFAMHYSGAFSAEDILTESLRWDTLHGTPRRELQKTHLNSVSRERKLRIGYVSPDFGRHPVGFFLLPVVDNHDHEKFTIYCYSNRRQEDTVTRRLRAASDYWRQVAGMGDDELARMIRTDEIDILVDLAGHTAGNRLTLFTMKPSPIQVTWAGYVGTTGLSAIDYLISDRLETPDGVDHLHVEKIVRLPGDYICYEPPAYAGEVAALPMLNSGYCTFGCFNNLNKVTAEVVELWATILHNLPGACLVMVTGQLDDLETRRRYHRLFSNRSVGHRVELCGAVPHQELLRRYNDVDISLDPFPYSGGLTTLESLWMGVPVVTLAGERFAGRHSVTHLTAVGMPELIAGNHGEYLDIAVSLAGNPHRLQELRQSLRPHMAASPVCDGRRFTENLERAYREMWLHWCAEQGG